MLSGNETCPPPAPQYSESSILLWKSKRLRIIAFLFCLTVINFTSRATMSVAAQPIASHFGWDNATIGIVMSVYFWTYITCVVPMGGLVDRLGASKVATLSISFWSAMTMLTGFVGGLTSMIAVRLAFGLGICGTWPACAKVAGAWFPAGERGRVSSFYQSGATFGAAFGIPAFA